jgi:hypothetical protein
LTTLINETSVKSFAFMDTTNKKESSSLKMSPSSSITNSLNWPNFLKESPTGMPGLTNK